MINGLVKNSTVVLDSLFFWVISMNRRGLRFIRPKENPDEEELLLNQEDLDKKDLLKNNLKKTYEVQKGAAEGKSICNLKL